MFNSIHNRVTDENVAQWLLRELEKELPTAIEFTSGTDPNQVVGLPWGERIVDNLLDFDVKTREQIRQVLKDAATCIAAICEKSGVLDVAYQRFNDAETHAYLADHVAQWFVRRVSNHGTTLKEELLHVTGVKRHPSVDMVFRDHGQLWLNGQHVGWLEKGRTGYTLSLDGWYWRNDVPNQDRGGSTARRVPSVTEGMALAQEMLVPGSGTKIGVVMQM